MRGAVRGRAADALLTPLLTRRVCRGLPLAHSDISPLLHDFVPQLRTGVVPHSPLTSFVTTQTDAGGAGLGPDGDIVNNLCVRIAWRSEDLPRLEARQPDFLNGPGAPIGLAFLPLPEIPDAWS